MARPARVLVVASALLTAAMAGAPSATSSAGKALETERSSSPGPSVRGNGLIAFTSNRNGNNDVWVANVDGSGQTALTTSTRSDSQPDWSPNGKKLAFTSDRTRNNDVWVMNADGTGQTNLSNQTRNDSQPSWSPEGTRIAFTSNRSGNNDVWVMNADGTGQAALTTSTQSDSQPSWSPDGTKIAFTSNRSGNNDVWVMNADGTLPVNLTHRTKSDSQPAWSPDGATIAFTSNRSGNNDVWVMNADGTGSVNRSNNTASDVDPTFSPDHGSRILFTSTRDGRNQVYVMSAFDGSNQVNITHGNTSDSLPRWQPLAASPANGSPIQHVVVLYLENHSFDNVLGLFCVQTARCDGATSGELPDGTIINLAPAADFVPQVAHDGDSQRIAINGGEMNGYGLITGCDASKGFQCYSQYQQTEIPNLWDLASSFVVSDRTFELSEVPSWHAHLELAASQLDGFAQTENPTGAIGPGWGCDSGKIDDWQATIFDPITQVPTCVPEPDGSGPFTTSPVPWVSTIMNRFDEAALSWNIYAASSNSTFAYGWAICPTFADCLYTDQAQQVLLTSQFEIDAAAGNLPNLSLVMPQWTTSQHNNTSMLTGDNWIADNVNAVMNGPDWDTTTIFITYDDCGCFYDHVVPPPGLGIRVPMVIVSPFARAGTTDSTTAAFSSMLAYVEHTFGLAPLSPEDANAYDYANSFDYGQQPLRPIALSHHPAPDWVTRYVAAHPPSEDDPT